MIIHGTNATLVLGTDRLDRLYDTYVPDIPEYTAEMTVFAPSRLSDFIPYTKARFTFGDVVIEQTIIASGFRPHLPDTHASVAYKKIMRYLRRKGRQPYEYWMTLS